MNREEKIEAIRKGNYFVKWDIAVFATAVILIALFTLFAFLGQNKGGDCFSVYYKGDKIFSASLDREAEYIFYIENGRGTVREYDGTVYTDYNRIKVEGRKVRVTDADCPDLVCVWQGAVGQGIICLPHDLKIVVEQGGTGTDL